MNTLTLVDDFLSEVFPALNQKQVREWHPRVDLREEQNKFVICAELPGLSEKDFKLEFNDGVLTLSGERKDDRTKDVPYFKRERIFGSFERSFNFGNAVNEDSISAKLVNGILEIELQKKDEKKSKVIQIETRN